jgi:hypothetical protein
MTHDEWLLIRKLYVDAMTLQALANRLVSNLKPLADNDPRADSPNTGAAGVRGAGVAAGGDHAGRAVGVTMDGCGICGKPGHSFSDHFGNP